MSDARQAAAPKPERQVMRGKIPGLFPSGHNHAPHARPCPCARDPVLRLLSPRLSTGKPIFAFPPPQTGQTAAVAPCSAATRKERTDPPPAVRGVTYERKPALTRQAIGGKKAKKQKEPSPLSPLQDGRQAKAPPDCGVPSVIPPRAERKQRRNGRPTQRMALSPLKAEKRQEFQCHCVKKPGFAPACF